MSDFNSLQRFIEGSEMARRVYLRQVRRIIGLFYLLISTYVPLMFGLTLIYLNFHTSLTIIDPVIQIIIYSPLVYSIYIIFSSILLFKLRKIPSVMKKIREIKSNKPRTSKIFYSSYFYYFLSIGIVSSLGLYALLVGGEVGEVVEIVENFLILLLIIKYFYYLFSLLEVDKWDKEDYIALIGAIIGFIGGTVFNSYLFFVFSISWMYAGLSLLRKNW